jgi:hypothetical protein
MCNFLLVETSPHCCKPLRLWLQSDEYMFGLHCCAKRSLVLSSSSFDLSASKSNDSCPQIRHASSYLLRALQGGKRKYNHSSTCPLVLLQSLRVVALGLDMQPSVSVGIAQGGSIRF